MNAVKEYGMGGSTVYLPDNMPGAGVKASPFVASDEPCNGLIFRSLAVVGNAIDLIIASSMCIHLTN